MDNILIQRFNQQALDLFSDVRRAFNSSAKENIRSQAMLVPSTFVDEGKKIRIVFIGQYSAGKSSILSILTGKKLKIGQGITTDKCQILDWNGIEVVDTPGIHTQKRPDHDEITYKAMAEADLLVFVCTSEGFSANLGQHFRKLLVEKGKGNEMMLVFNKMEDSEYGNEEEGIEEFFKHDVLPVISPEYSSDDLYITYIDTDAYLYSLEVTGTEKEKFLEISGYRTLYANINKFLEKKKVLGKCTTSLTKLEQLLSEALAQFPSGDTYADGSLILLNQQRSALVEAQGHIKSESYNIIRRKTQQVNDWGNEIANKLTSSDSQDEVNARLREKYEATDSIFEQAAKELEEIIKFEENELQKRAKAISESEIGNTLKNLLERKIGEIQLSQKTASSLQTGAGCTKEAGEWLTKFATSQNAQTGWNAIFKLGTYSGSGAHKAVLTIGRFVGHKFKPWEAVKMASRIGTFGRILGVAGSLLGVALQIWQDQQERKVEKQLKEYRNDIRNTFTEAANVIDLQFDECTQTWVNENITPKIAEIDQQIKEIQDSVDIRQKEFTIYKDLLERTRNLIAEIHKTGV